MSRSDRGVLFASGAALSVLLAGCVLAGEPGEYPASYGLGTPLPDNGANVKLTAIPPDGEGLPPGEGRFGTGEAIYAERCAACHGADLQGTSLGMALVGGRGSLAGDDPVATVESFWPSAPAVFSYIRNTMPPTTPGSLCDDEVYSLMAFILGVAEVIPKDMIVARDNLAEIPMPNRDGFVPDPRPDVQGAADAMRPRSSDREERTWR